MRVECSKSLWYARRKVFGSRFFPELLSEWTSFPSQLHQCNTLTGCAPVTSTCHISFLFHVTTLSHCITNVSNVTHLSCDLPYGSHDPRHLPSSVRVTYPFFLSDRSSQSLPRLVSSDFIQNTHLYLLLQPDCDKELIFVSILLLIC